MNNFAIIFRDFTAIRKLIVADKRGLLLDTECPTAAALTLVPNPSITEVRLRFEKAPFVDIVIGKLVADCPSLKNLFVHKISNCWDDEQMNYRTLNPSSLSRCI